MPLNVPPCLVDDPDVKRIAEEVFIIIIVTTPPLSLSPPPSSPSPWLLWRWGKRRRRRLDWRGRWGRRRDSWGRERRGRGWPGRRRPRGGRSSQREYNRLKNGQTIPHSKPCCHCGSQYKCWNKSDAVLRCSSHTMQCDLQDDQNLKFFLSLLEELLADTLKLEVESGSSLWDFL